MKDYSEPVSCSIMLEWRKLHPLSERLASLGIMGEPLKVPLIILNTIVLWWSDGIQGRGEGGFK